jgi:hypothetical protein
MKRPGAVDSFKTLVSDSSVTHRPEFELDFSKRQSQMLNLPIIFNGVDSFELRIWSFGFWTRTDLFVLRYSENRWVAANCVYYDTDGVIDSLHLIAREVKNDTASRIRDYLIQDSILSLPSQIAIPNFRDNTSDGETYCIEIATNKLYKQLTYHNPEYFKEVNNKRFLGLLKFLESQFRIYYPN